MQKELLRWKYTGSGRFSFLRNLKISRNTDILDYLKNKNKSAILKNLPYCGHDWCNESYKQPIKIVICMCNR